MYNFKELNEETKQAKNFLKGYQLSTKTTIYDAYSKPSSKKISSYNELLYKMKELNGYGMKIISHCCDYYSCGYIIEENNQKYLICETYANSYKIKYNK